MTSSITLSSRFKGILLGTAVGDALGLPREGLSRRRSLRIFGPPPLTHRLLFGRGLCSDDTEHTLLLAQSLIESNGDPHHFAEAFAARLRWWLLGVPAGVGLATLRGILKLWIGFSPERSGVFSAGNGPAMRSAIIGAHAAGDLAKLKALVHASTSVTHSDPKAEQGALAVALAAHHGIQNGGSADDYFVLLHEQLSDPQLLASLDNVKIHLDRKSNAREYASAVGCERGVSGYVYHTVPIAIFVWLRHFGDFRATVETAVMLGGDSDTVGAIAGALAGAAGEESIPAEWTEGLVEWPRTVNWMRSLGSALADQTQRLPAKDLEHFDPLFCAALVLRNVLFLLIILAHGFRRILPPY